MQQAEEAEASERARAEQLEAELLQAERELSQVTASSSELDGLEERYWHDFNDFQLQLRAHVEERDVLLNKVRAHRLLGCLTQQSACQVAQRAAAALLAGDYSVLCSKLCAMPADC